MAAVLALLSALAYGVGDFCGGLASRRLPPPAVVLRSNTIGLLALLALVPFVTGTFAGRDLAVGMAGGIAGGTGVALMYRAMSFGAMSVVAPITAVVSAVVPVVAGLASGERPSGPASLGVVLALVAVVLISMEEGAGGRLSPAVVVTALAAGLGFGLFFVMLDVANDDAGLWPVVGGRIASVSLFAAIALLAPASRAPAGVARQGSTPWLLVGCGLLDAWANALYLVATTKGLLTIVAVLGALYPASTLVLARVVLKERLAVVQLVGVGTALTAVALITA